MTDGQRACLAAVSNAMHWTEKMASFTPGEPLNAVQLDRTRREAESLKRVYAYLSAGWARGDLHRDSDRKPVDEEKHGG